MVALDRSSPLPLYHQLKQEILRQIHNGTLDPGSTLPGERELENQYDVSQITVRRALSELAQEGSISRQPGRGSFVLAHKIEHSSVRPGGLFDDVVAQGLRVWSQLLEYKWLAATRGVAVKLNVSHGSSVLFIQRLLCTGSEPLGVFADYYSVGEDVVLTHEEIESTPITRLLEQQYGIALGRVERTIEATLVLENEARLLQVRPGSPVLLVELLIYEESGRPLCFKKNLYRGDRYKYRLASP